jgi:hypothetical protein
MKASPAGRVTRAGVIALLMSLCLTAFAASESYASPGPVTRMLTVAQAARHSGLDTRSYALMMAQIPLDKAATAIQLAAAKQGAGRDGYFNTQVNDAKRVLTVRWHGTLPPGVALLIRRLRARVEIRVAHTRYSLASLLAAIRRAERIDPAVAGGYPLADGSGIHVEVRATRAGPAGALISARLGIAVAAVPSGAIQLQATCQPAPNDPEPHAGTRCWDLPPGFWGGDVITNQTATPHTYCSGGFGVHDAYGNTYMMTAAHCAVAQADGDLFTNGTGNATMGRIIDVPGPHDGAIIPTSAGNMVYDGLGIVEGDSGNTAHVAGQLVTSLGDRVCESGSFGGLQCNMQVTALNFAPAGWPWNSLAEAVLVGNGFYSIGGDSGGPVYSLGGGNNVLAQGIIEGTRNDSFTGDPIAEVFTPISVLSNDMGVWVNT